MPHAGAPARPDHVGAGASYRVLPGIRLEGAHRWVRAGADTATKRVQDDCCDRLALRDP